MAYASNYYNYQIGVIFAILIGGLLLLALILGGIYFVCVVNMRGGQDEKRRTRTPSSTRPWPGPQAAQPPYTSFQNPPMPTTTAEYPPRTTVQTSPPVGYTTQPLVQPYNTEIIQGTRVRELQPEFSYQQGPTQWTTVSPVIVESTYPISPGAGGGYHMSSV